MTRQYKYGLAFVLAVGSLAATAQPRVEAMLDTVPRDGFYRVALAPGLMRYTRTDFGDIRIRDEKGEPVPFEVRRRLGKSTYSFLTVPIARIEDTGTRTLVTFQIPGARSSGFQVFFTNTSAQRRAVLTGSNDRASWYSLTDSFVIAPKSVPEGGSGTATLTLHYPANTYRYVRLEINNGATAPLNIEQAGVFMGEPEPELWNAKRRLPFSDSTVGGTTIVQIANPRHEFLEQVFINVTRPRLFRRNVVLRDPSTGRELAIGMLDNKQTRLIFPATRATALELFIENGDNPRLQIDSIEGNQRLYDIIAFLEKGHRFTLGAGDSTATMPAFDLAGFTDSARNFAQPVSYGPIRVSAATKPEKDHRSWIWIALVIGIGMLGWFSYSLLRDMQREKRSV
ncbi:MAG: hypothetical protein EOO15_05655 [Chitinophagaceae bacterium]|nr:MAG: hypothetical protein EOO15_05655 [Chitinophagaceae bacterium]